MKLADRRKRRRFLARALGAFATASLAGCQKLSTSEWFPKVLGVAEPLSESAFKLVGRRAMAQEFTPADLSPTFRSNGTDQPDTDA